MEDRLDALGGTLHIVSSPGNGTTLRATIPLMTAVAAG
jgi:signal transduction histidine kinase